jgi:uncharacterized protein YfbU (UPF0304 family)
MRIAIVVLSVISVSFAIAYFSILKKLDIVTKAFTRLVVVNSTMQEALQSGLNNPADKEDQDIHKENFIKFLSDSRDWAYEYIEEVQGSLKKFVEEIEPEIKYFEEYGSPVAMQPNYNSMKKIVKSYKELIKLLPEESDDRR